MGEIRYREFLNHPDTTVTHGVDTHSELYAAFPGVKCSADFQDVTRSGVDVVVVATPNRHAPETVVAALDAGKHVFCEKPPGRTLEDIEAIIKAERRNPGLKLKFGFNHRYHAGIQEARRVIDSGRLGHILWIRAVYGKAGHEGFQDTWRSKRETAGGGILLDQGIHMLDLLRFFCGDFTEIKSMVSTSYWDIDVEDNAFALMRDTKGRTAMLHSSSTHWNHRFSLEIYLSEGYLSVNGILSSTRSYGDETLSIARNHFGGGSRGGTPSEEIIYFDSDPSWELEIKDFVDSILNDTPTNSGTSEDALKAMQMVYAVYENDETFLKSGNRFRDSLGD